MATIAVAHGAQLCTVYDDRFIEIFRALGTVHIERASEVEYDHATSNWIATRNGCEIARGKNRAQVIAAEVVFLENEIRIGGK